ncbi:19162_t:CDS:2, partial [Gigaspora margarita]
KIEKEIKISPKRDLILPTETEPTETVLSRKFMLELLECSTIIMGLKQTSKIEEVVKNRHKEVAEKNLVEGSENKTNFKEKPFFIVQYGSHNTGLIEKFTKH